MLEKIVMSNFKSFKNETIIDFAKTNYSMLPENVADNGILKSCIFVGANASGKSNALIAIKFLLDAMFRDKKYNSDLYQCMFCSKQSYSLEYSFIIDNQRIKYHLVQGMREEDIQEKLFLDGKLVMERMGSNAKSYIAEKDGAFYDSSVVDPSILFLRTLYFNTQFASNKTLQKWMEYLLSSVYMDLSKKSVFSYGKQNYSLGKYLDDNGVDEFNDFFEKYNFKQKISYEHESKGPYYTISVGQDENLKDVFFKREQIGVPIPLAKESTGNQTLLNILPAFLNVVRGGGLLLIDEFSSGFHNELETMLVKFFNKESQNAQLIFVSHSTNLLSNSILRPDQEYSVDFVAGEGSVVKRFSDEQPRAAQNVEKMYNSGVFGGLPGYKEV